ncbi:hypothetical protein JRQ81_018215 [Phrynocephalus forsythii]|uniref:Uncharacterized protein n=1 Tax=Phrynocephalus forsythii TaxID=171643 RepID=A0A9Q1B191_9SAUR|nr:hypothetical protein JRQ81_018215 [Phrynocephalus forsythii]
MIAIAKCLFSWFVHQAADKADNLIIAGNGKWNLSHSTLRTAHTLKMFQRTLGTLRNEMWSSEMPCELNIRK